MQSMEHTGSFHSNTGAPNHKQIWQQQKSEKAEIYGRLHSDAASKKKHVSLRITSMLRKRPHTLSKRCASCQR
eukprot:6198915-Amphidinium_carterae.1